MTGYGYAMYRFDDMGRPQRTDQLGYFDPNVVFLPLSEVD
jgi:hypothetical protein